MVKVQAIRLYEVTLDKARRISNGEGLYVAERRQE
jgi:hypothetical protein